MITPGGNPVCRYCKRVMDLGGKNICRNGICMCGDGEDTHRYIEDHGFVDSAEYLGWECEAE